MKRVIILILVVALCIGMTACGGVKSSTTETPDNQTPAIERSVDAIATELGLTNGSDTYYSMIGAIAGKEYNDGTFEIYQYDLASAEYAKIKNGEATNGISFSAYNNGFALLCVKAADEEVIAAFKALTIKD